MDSSEFALNNSYPKIRGAYEHFRDRTKHFSSAVASEEQRRSSNASLHVGEFVDSLNRVAKNQSEQVLNAYAMVTFYFSAMEVLFDTLYALGDRTVDFRSFRNLTWNERFLTVLPIKSKPELQKMYKKLLACKRNFRDKILHGLGGEENFLVFLDGIGLVPISYEFLTQSAHYTPVYGDVPLADEAVQVFDDFDRYLEEDDRLSRCVAYAESGMIIPFHGEQLDSLRTALNSPADFQEWLQEELEYQDYLADQW